jgi:sulfonate transport system substrate-binding protein
MLSRRSIALFAGACLLLSGCGKSEVTTLRIGAVGGAQGKTSSTGNVTVAEAKGFFADEFAKDHIKVQVIYFTGTGPAINEAFAQNQVDFAEYGALPNVIGVAGGAPTRLVVARHTALTYYLAAATGPGRPVIDSVEQMRGHKITVQMGTMPHLLLVQILERHGLKESDVTIVNLQSAEALAAFTSGSVDAIFGATPTLLLRDKGQAKVIASTKELPPGLNLGGFLVNRDFEKAHPDLTGRMTKVMVHTYDWASRDENRSELLRLYARSGIPERYYAEEYPAPLKTRFSPLIDDQVRDGYRRIGQFALDHKLVRQAPDFSTWFEPKYQVQALKDLHLEGYWSPAPAQP